MLKIGSYNSLKILKEVSFGLFLDGFEHGEILLPKKYVPKSYLINMEIDVFVYTDSEDRLVATTLNPKAEVGDFALLKLIAKDKIGGFFDWGLPKDLFVPQINMRKDSEIGRFYLLYIYLDSATNRVVATTEIDKCLDKEESKFIRNEEVDLMIYRKTELGFKTIINNKFSGFIFHNEIFQAIKIGQKLKGYIKNIREDGKIDVTLRKTGINLIDNLADEILNKLDENNGFLPFNDKSSPSEIKDFFNTSKKSFQTCNWRFIQRERNLN